MTTFSIRVEMRTKNGDRIAKLAARVADFSEPLNQIVREWAVGNRSKFVAARSAEDTGVQQFVDVFWQPLTSKAYQKRKRAKGWADWLMVATGALRDALTSVAGFGQFVDEHRAVFGKPLEAAEADKAMFNSSTRQVIFLGRGDRQMIRRNIQNYLTFGAGYNDVLADRSARAYALEQEAAQMDIDFAQTVAA